jgi:hypothetical protein
MLFTTLRNLMMVESEVPFGGLIDAWVLCNQINFRQLVDQSREYEAAYLAWETVRSARNPYFNKGSGFEGYFVGVFKSSEAVLDHLLAIGHHILDSNVRLYPHQHTFRRHLMETLARERSDPDALAAWSDELGATVARLRGAVNKTPDAYWFQSETYRLVSCLPAIRYVQGRHDLAQYYAVGFGIMSPSSRIAVNVNQLKPCDQDAGRVMWSIGQFGHPLVRSYLRESYHGLPGLAA